MPSRRRAAASILVASMAGAAAMPAAGKPVSEQIDPTAYPELAPEAVLPLILEELRHTLPDVYSVREVRICPATHIKLKDNKPTEWATRFEFNAKNQNGGYTGIQRDVAIIRNGRVRYPIGNAPQLGRTGLDNVFSRMVDKQMAPCKPIPDATVQQMLTGAK